MASSSHQSEESRNQIPSEIMSGKSASDSSTKFKNQKQSELSVPLSPQLRYFLSRVSPPSSTRFSPSLRTSASLALGQTIASFTGGSYAACDSETCPDNGVDSGFSYLSTNSLLKKMIRRCFGGRRYDEIAKGKDEELYAEESCLCRYGSALKIYGLTEDVWATFPIQDHPNWGYFDCNSSFQSVAYVTVRKSTRYSVKAYPGPESLVRVTNRTGTTFLDRTSCTPPLQIRGPVECPVDGQIFYIAHDLPQRFEEVEVLLKAIRQCVDELGDEFLNSDFDFGQEILQNTGFACPCDGNANHLRPIISDNPNKIDWQFLFLGFGLGFCTIDQLKYYCIQRRLPLCDNKNKILVTVIDDLCLQIFLQRFGA